MRTSCKALSNGNLYFLHMVHMNIIKKGMVIAMWTLYDTLLSPIPDNIGIDEIFQCKSCTLVRVDGKIGGAATNCLDTAPLVFPSGNYTSLSWKQCASLIKSWNFREASIGAAALNAYYNQRDKISSYQTLHPDWIFPEETNPFTAVAEKLSGKKAASIGHFRNIEEHFIHAKEAFVLERAPRPGDYPDSACEYLLPDMDVVFITGFTLVNKTLPRLLKLAAGAHIIFVGPSICMAPSLFSMGVSELSGTLLSDFEAAKSYALTGAERPLLHVGSPMRFGIKEVRL